MTDDSVVLLPVLCRFVSKTPDRPVHNKKSTEPEGKRSDYSGSSGFVKPSAILKDILSVLTCWVVRGGVGRERMSGGVGLPMEKFCLQVCCTVTGANSKTQV